MSDSIALSDFIDILIDNINTNGLWSTVLDCVPLIAITVLFGLGVYFVIRIIVNMVQWKFHI